MTAAEQYSEYFKSCIATARRISLALGAFAIVAIYIGVIGNAAQRSELQGLEDRRQALLAELSTFETVLHEVRAFYEGPAEAESLNFASQIYALKNTREFVAEIRQRGDAMGLDQTDKSFFEFQTDLISHNAFELQSILGGLISQKERRVPFENLSFSDLLDLDYHKGKDAWQIYYEWSAMRYALYRENDYGFTNYPDATAPLEQRYHHFIKKSEDSRGTSTKPKDAGRNDELVSEIEAMSQKGFRSLGEMKSQLSALDQDIEAAQKSLANSIKMPFIDQNIEVSALVWLVPLTITFSLIFELYYVRKARRLAERVIAIDADTAAVLSAYPWLLLDTRSQTGGFESMIAMLRLFMFAAPIVVSCVLVLTSSDQITGLGVLGAIFTLAAAGATWVLMSELSRFRDILPAQEQSDAVTG